MITDAYLTWAAVVLAVVTGFYALELSHWLAFIRKDQLSKIAEIKALNERLDVLMQRAKEEVHDDRY